MKTIEKLSFPKLENEYLENILRQLINQYAIIQMFFSKQESSVFSFLIINIENNMDAQQLQQNKWVRKMKENFQIIILFMSSSKLHHHYSLGQPFVAFYCRPTTVIFHSEDLQDSIFATTHWKKYKKRFSLYEDNFYHDHDLHSWQVKNLISEGSSNSVFTTYSRLIEFDIYYLEALYSGNKSASLSLDERINNLIQYVPDIQKYFVKNSRNKYYLTDLFVKAKEATADDDLLYKNEMYESVAIAEHGLCRLVEKRLDELKKGIKKGFDEKKELAKKIDTFPKDILLDTAIETILQSVEAEQIYLYHQFTYGEITIYYMLLIAIGAGNEKLKLVTQTLKNKIGVKYDFVLISHPRSWIQSNLYQHQTFFADIIQDKYLIYSSSKYLPEFHWEKPHSPYHADLYFYYKPTKDVALQFFTIANNPEENYQSLDYLFSEFFLFFCRTYIFVKTYYLPNNLTSQALWQLCIYADPDIRKYNYLLEQFWTDCFPYLNKHRVLHHKLSKLNKEKVDQMNVIVEKLMSVLNNLVLEGRLLLPFEQDC